MNSSLRFRRISSRDDWAAPILSNGPLGEPSPRGSSGSLWERASAGFGAGLPRPGLAFWLCLSASLDVLGGAPGLPRPRMCSLPLPDVPPDLGCCAERQFRTRAFEELWTYVRKAGDRSSMVGWLFRKRAHRLSESKKYSSLPLSTPFTPATATSLHRSRREISRIVLAQRAHTFCNRFA